MKIEFTPEEPEGDVRCFFCRRRAEFVEANGFWYCLGCHESFVPTADFPDPTVLVDDLSAFLEKPTPAKKRLLSTSLDEFLNRLYPPKNDSSSPDDPPILAS